MSARTEVSIIPHLTYSIRGRTGDGIEGDGFALHTVHEVSASLSVTGGDLRMYAQGRMLRRDGQPGPRRGLEIDVSASQPAWLHEIMIDAEWRLDV